MSHAYPNNYPMIYCSSLNEPVNISERTGERIKYRSTIAHPCPEKNSLLYLSL